MKSLHTFLFIVTILSATTGWGQKFPLKPLSLEDMSNFKTTGSNWQIAGDVAMDRNGGMKVTPGKGILVNNVSDKDHEILEQAGKKQEWATIEGYKVLSAWEHGDLELELEFMMPKGSNSGIYLQGRYEVQLFDSWGVRSPKYGDLGGIYRNWENTPGQIYMGKAPDANAAKAPGLWQTLKISFQAPRFDAQGNKISNARFHYVTINGVTVHQNLEVPLATGGPVDKKEAALGPLFIQGDHGAVAFRNIKYRSLGAKVATTSDISYKYFEGSFKSADDLKTATPKTSGKIAAVTTEVLDNEDLSAARFDGVLNVPEDAFYIMTLNTTGGYKLVIDNQELMFNLRPDSWWDSKQSNMQLKAGAHPFTIYYYKDAGYMPPRLAWIIEGSAIQRSILTAFGSYPPDPNPSSSIYVSVGSKTRLLRAFLDFEQDRARRLTHTIGVGDPGGLHYIYDLKAGNVACAWRGDFVDATPMWNDRGDGSFRPIGVSLYTFIGQTLGVINSASDAFPTVYNEADFKTKGYAIDEATGRPIFRYTYKGIEVEERCYPSVDQNSLVRELALKGTIPAGTSIKLAEGKDILPMPDGSYVIDRKYYISLSGDDRASIRDFNGKKELILPAKAGVVKYSIIW
ncbi:family 16 glycoside hydrolase [Haliscomenobacter sp.]|uniref:family 16 glycoside hydrolase n=1 Tax=Haliscomenobacter sp. TaxID=2717303 RepID=UPI003364FB30